MRSWLSAPSIVLVILIGASVALRAWAGSRVQTPWINSDEITYSQMGRSLYQTGHLEILGEHFGFLSLLYPAIAGLPLLLRDVGTGYALLKAEQAVVMSLTAVPVYLWSRTLVRPWWAVTAAALTLAIPGLAYSGLIMTEAAFYPVVVLAAWAMAATLVHASLRNQALLLAALALAVATRVQALVLLPGFATAVLVKGFLDGAVVASIRRVAPTFAVLAAVVVGWSAYGLVGSRGGAALGGYQDLAGTHFDAAAAARFVVYHAADALLLTAVVPACGAALVVIAARSGDEHLRAYAAVASALAVWLVIEVGVFASRYVGHLAERNLLPLAPVLFIGFVVWLDQGVRRPRYLSVATAGGVLALLAYLPLSQWVPHALPDAFMLVPLERLQAGHPTAKLGVVVLYTALPLLALFLWVPRRFAGVLPVAVAAALVSTSVLVSNAVADQSRLLAPRLFGSSKTWIDRGARGPVVYLWAGEGDWNQVFENIFWNRDIRSVYAMSGPLIPGPLPQRIVQPTAAGVLRSVALCMSGRCRTTPASTTGNRSFPSLARNDGPPHEGYVVAGTSLFMRGTRVAAAPSPKLVLWRVTEPPSVSAWLAGVDITSELERNAGLYVVGGMNREAEFVFYGCRGGTLKLTLAAGEHRTVTVSRNGRAVRRLHLLPGEPRRVVLEGRPVDAGPASRIATRYRADPQGGGRLCDFGVASSGGPLEIRPLEFARR